MQLLRLHKQSAVEADVEHDEADVEEMRERLAERIERLRKSMADKGGSQAGPEAGDAG